MAQVRKTIRWRVAVSADTARSLRMFLVCRAVAEKGKLSRFIEEAVQARILTLTAAQAKSANANMTDADLSAKIDEALQWARKH